MRIKVDLKIFFLIIFYIITKNIRIFAYTFIFILIHELGHVFAGIFLGLKINKININLIGLSIEFENYGEERKINKIIIDSMGPCINAIILVFALIVKLEEIAYINLMIILINMLPIYPLDGGRILKTVLLYKKPYIETMRIVEKVSKNMLILITFASGILILYFKNIAFFLIIIYLWYLLFQENKKNRLIQKVFKTIENNS